MQKKKLRGVRKLLKISSSLVKLGYTDLSKETDLVVGFILDLLFSDSATRDRNRRNRELNKLEYREVELKRELQKLHVLQRSRPDDKFIKMRLRDIHFEVESLHHQMLIVKPYR